MAILPKVNSGANGDNTLENTGGWCCGDEQDEALCFFHAVIAGLSGTLSTGITINSVFYPFVSPIIIGTTQAALDALKNAIRTALSEAGYTNKDVMVTNVDGNPDILIGRSAATINSITVDGDNVEFDEGCEDYEVALKITDNVGTPIGTGSVNLRLWDNEEGAGTPLQVITGDGSGDVVFNLQAGKNYWIDCASAGLPGVESVACADTPVLKKITTDIVGIVTFSGADWAAPPKYPVNVTLAI